MNDSLPSYAESVIQELIDDRVSISLGIDGKNERQFPNQGIPLLDTAFIERRENAIARSLYRKNFDFPRPRLRRTD